jgi:Tol biopolymer transport system component
VGEDGITPIVSRPQPDRQARLAYVSSYKDANIWRIDTSAPGAPASSPPVVAIVSNRREAFPDLAPDGSRVTFTSTRSGENEVWVADVSDGNLIQLTSMGAIPGGPRWSPDGKTIAFHSNPAGNNDIFVVSAEGGKPLNLTSDSAGDAAASFSRDGWVYFTSNRRGRQATWKVPVKGGPAEQVTNLPWGRESPDGTHVYFIETANVNTPGTVWRVPVKGGTPERLLEGVAVSMFDVIDGGIYYIERIPGQARLQYFDFRTRKTTTVAGNLGNVDTGLSASPDGRTILFSRIERSVTDLMLVENFR